MELSNKTQNLLIDSNTLSVRSWLRNLWRVHDEWFIPSLNSNNIQLFYIRKNYLYRLIFPRSWINVKNICGRGLPYGGALITDESLPPPRPVSTWNNVKWNTAPVRLLSDRKCGLTHGNLHISECVTVNYELLLRVCTGNKARLQTEMCSYFTFWRAATFEMYTLCIFKIRRLKNSYVMATLAICRLFSFNMPSLEILKTIIFSRPFGNRTEAFEWCIIEIIEP